MQKLPFALWFGLVAFVAAQPALARGPEVTPDEYQLYMDWTDGKQDPRLEGLNDDQKRAKIAKNLGVKPADIKRAVDKVTPVAGTIEADTKKAVMEAASGTVLKGRVVEVMLDASQGHVVAGFKWKCGDARDIDKEAAWAAWAAAEGGPVVKTLALWCVDGSDTKQFSAKIGRTAFEKISRDQIERFATSRYIKLFEEVKRGPHT